MSNLAHTLFSSEAGRHLRVASSLPLPSADPVWGLSYLAGKLVELRSAPARAGLTAALGLVRNAQEAGETAVWITSTDSVFFACDAREGGVDLEALAVVRLPGAEALLRAADKLARCGAFGLIVLDFASFTLSFFISPAQQSRLLGLAQKHQTAMVFFTPGQRPFSVAGSLISLRGEAQRRCVGADLYEIDLCVLKDKQRGPGRHHAELCRGPAGLC